MLFWKNVLNYTLLLSLSFLFSCKKDNDNAINNFNYYVRINIGSETFQNTNSSNFYDTEMIMGITGCTLKPFTQREIYSFTNPFDSYNLYLYIDHFQDSSDFVSSSNGIFGINNLDSVFDGTLKPCNLDISIHLDDNNTYPKWCRLQRNSIVNNVTSLNRKSETTDGVTYDIEGSFSCLFKNVNNVIIPVSGNYRTFLTVLK